LGFEKDSLAHVRVIVVSPCDVNSARQKWDKLMGEQADSDADVEMKNGMVRTYEGAIRFVIIAGVTHITFGLGGMALGAFLDAGASSAAIAAAADAADVAAESGAGVDEITSAAEAAAKSGAPATDAGADAIQGGVAKTGGTCTMGEGVTSGAASDASSIESATASSGAGGAGLGGAGLGTIDGISGAAGDVVEPELAAARESLQEAIEESADSLPSEPETKLWKAPAKDAGPGITRRGDWMVPRDPEAEVQQGFDPDLYPGNGPYFGMGDAGRALAEDWAEYYQNGLQEFSMPSSEYDSLVEQGIIQPDPYYPPGVSVHVPPEGLPGFNDAITEGSPNVYHPPGTF
jgi:hypothetical protein